MIARYEMKVSVRTHAVQGFLQLSRLCGPGSEAADRLQEETLGGDPGDLDHVGRPIPPLLHRLRPRHDPQTEKQRRHVMR